jgi:hypothetical protein
MEFARQIECNKIDTSVDWYGSDSKRLIKMFNKKGKTIYVSLYSDGLSMSKSSNKYAYPLLTAFLNLDSSIRYVRYLCKSLLQHF